jgi:hypothetical protein
VNVPRLDRAGINTGEIYLSEFPEMGRVVSQHVHDLAALVQYLSQGRDDDAFNHIH